MAALLPFVTIYDQDSRGKSSGWLEHQARALLQNGRVIYLDNRGRESRVHLYHIVNNWHNLSRYDAPASYHTALVELTPALAQSSECRRYTWFSQDIPSKHAEDRVEVRQSITAASFWGLFLDAQKHYRTISPICILVLCCRPSSCLAAQRCWGLGPPGVSAVMKGSGLRPFQLACPPIFSKWCTRWSRCGSEVLQVEWAMHSVVEIEQPRRADPVTRGCGEPTRESSLSQTSASTATI